MDVVDAVGVLMKAKDVMPDDVVFSPDEQGGKVKETYWSKDDVVIISFHGQFGLQCHPDTELLVARKGQVL
jgi:hypothetical protein